ncbi:MAG: hypothetical protein NC293_03555 [Roseburia sp.]|nr:hypothetical protein [Roseburia sp.]
MKLQNKETVKSSETLVSNSVEELKHLVGKLLKDDHNRIVVTVSMSEGKGEDENGKS